MLWERGLALSPPPPFLRLVPSAYRATCVQGGCSPHELIFSGETSHCLINPLASLIKLAMYPPSQAHPILPWWSPPKASSQPVWMGMLGKDALSW